MLTPDDVDPSSLDYPPVVRRYSPPAMGTRWLGPVPMSRQVGATGLVVAAGVTLAVEAVRIVRRQRRSRQNRQSDARTHAPVTFEWTHITIERRELY